MNPVGKAFVRVYSRAFSNQCLRERGLQYEREEDDSEKEESQRKKKKRERRLKVLLRREAKVVQGSFPWF